MTSCDNVALFDFLYLMFTPPPQKKSGEGDIIAAKLWHVLKLLIKSLSRRKLETQMQNHPKLGSQKFIPI